MSKGLIRPGTGVPLAAGISANKSSKMKEGPTVTKSDNAVQCVKYHRRIDHLVVVKLAKVFDIGNPTLVELEIVLL